MHHVRLFDGTKQILHLNLALVPTQQAFIRLSIRTHVADQDKRAFALTLRFNRRGILLHGTGCLDGHGDTENAVWIQHHAGGSRQPVHVFV